ncbi:MAG: flagellar hook-associated protein FlgK [Nitrospirota bacterium]
MSLFGLFDIGKSALFASQTALSVTSHNIANANTPGFNRQEAILEITSPVAVKGGYLGRGVTIAGIKRYYDRFIQSQLLGQYQNYGRSYALNQALSQVEQIFNEAGDTGLSASLTDYFNAWHDVATNPEGQPQRIVLIEKANTLVFTAKRMEQGILENLSQTNENMDDIVDRVNSIASDIAALNGKITQIEAGLKSEKANDLRDQRDNLLNELSNLVEFTSYEDKNNGSLTVMVGMRNLVYGEKTNTLSIKVNEDGKNDLYLDGINITGNITKGQLGGIIAVRDDIETNTLGRLRRLIASLTKEINILHSAGYGLDGTTGNNFFNPLQLSTRDFSPGADITATIADISQLTLDEYNITFDAASNYYVYNKQTGALVTSGAYVSGNPITFDGIQVVITGAITSTDRFSISPLTDAIDNFGVAITDPQKVAAASSDADLPGDNSNALNIAQLPDNAITDLGSLTFMDYYRGIVSGIGSMSNAASNSLKFDDNLLSEIENRRESISGVSLDEEAANLIRFQRSFEAGARMIKVTDELLQTILNL